MNQPTTHPIDCLYRAYSHHPPHDSPAQSTLTTRLQEQGARALTDAELLALLLQDAPQQEPCLPLAQQILREQQGLIGLARVPLDELGASYFGAARIKAALELARRLAQAAPGERPVINRASKLAPQLLLDMRPLEQEVLKCALLTTRLHLIKIVDVHQGTLNSNLVRIGDVFREPVRLGAAAILLAHNHPSGDTTPSTDDVETTRHLITAGDLLGIDVLDHLIIGDTWISMRAQGLGWPPAAHVEAYPPLLNERSARR
jgi:DNA repair protein RadC